jgi:F420-dependent oxidoreductase-like protein
MTLIDYGLQIEPQYGYTYSHIRDAAQRAEHAGFESIWLSDHFLIRPDAADVNCLEAWTTLAALARDTSRLRLGTLVSSQSYRNPALAAKMAATLDHVSGGRLYYGVGAGWKQVEYDAYGFPFPGPAARIRQLDEALEIAERMWTQPKATYEGRHYSVRNCVSAPKPVQSPLPIVVGGTGDRLLRVSAKHAHMVNFAWNTPLDTYEDRLRVLELHCAKLGRDYDGIRKSAGLHLALEGAEGHVPAPYERYSGAKKWEPKAPKEAAETIRGYADLGVTHFVIVFPYGSEASSAEHFMRHVAPRV